MNQPELGLKVAELRQLKALTQEQLAEMCEVSPRTIQRIESGEVDPRAYTLQCLRAALDFDFGGQRKDYESLWLALMHLSTAVLAFYVPLLLWFWKKDQSSRVDRQGRQVLNFQITLMLLLFTLSFCMAAGLVGMPAILSQTVGDRYAGMSAALGLFMIVLLAFLGMYCVAMAVINTVRALTEKSIHYPLSIPFLK